MMQFIFIIVIFLYVYRSYSERSRSLNGTSYADALLEVVDLDYASLLAEENDAGLVHECLKEEFPFIRSWNENDQLKFVWRTIRIRAKKHFHGAEGMIITMRHEIIISATLARLTMGLNKTYDLPKFELIEVYPREFYSKLIGQHVKGLTIGNGRLFLSWKHFQDGHFDHSDKVHVGLHEFAHALKLQFNQFKNLPQWSSWRNTALPVMESIRSSNGHFFRNYGATNEDEFWAVSVETFFEQPEKFKWHFPELFRETCNMLNQYPKR